MLHCYDWYNKSKAICAVRAGQEYIQVCKKKKLNGRGPCGSPGVFCTFLSSCLANLSNVSRCRFLSSSACFNLSLIRSSPFWRILSRSAEASFADCSKVFRYFSFSFSACSNFFFTKSPLSFSLCNRLDSHSSVMAKWFSDCRIC